MDSLQDQFLKAGLVDKKKIKQTDHDKSNQKKDERRTGAQNVDEARLAALETQHKMPSGRGNSMPSATRLIQPGFTR